MTNTNKVFLGSYEGLTAIICGSAPCLYNEYKEVTSSIKDYITIGINEAVSGIFCDKLITSHVEEIAKFKAKSINPLVETHTSKPLHPDNKNQSDYFWDNIKRGASSAIDAVQIAQRMKFKNIILVGCPMTGGDGYFYAKKAKENVEGCPRFGNAGNESLVQRHQVRLKEIVSENDFSNVSSMSGYTAKIFGFTKLR